MLAATFPRAPPTAPSPTRPTVWTVNVLKVVYAPRPPVPITVRTVGDRPWYSPNPVTNPSRKQPLRLTTTVPHTQPDKNAARGMDAHPPPGDPPPGAPLPQPLHEIASGCADGRRNGERDPG